MICMTTQCIGYEEVMRMTEDERDWWYEKCEEQQDEMNEEAQKAKSRR